MSAYTDVIKALRAEENPQVMLATMTSPNECKIGSLQLYKEDLYIAERLTKKMCIGVNVPISHSDNSKYSYPLKKGDIVVVCRINKQTYAIIERVVRA